jgi:hypothetical protein
MFATRTVRTAAQLTLVAAGLAGLLACGPPTRPTPAATFAVNAVAPGAGSTLGPTQVTIYGSGFTPGARVSVDAVDVPATVAGATHISATLPGHAAGSVEVVVTNGDGERRTVPSGFTYVAPAPPPPPMQIERVEPLVGSTSGGTLLAIFGPSLQRGATVSIDGKVVPAELGDFSALYIDTPAHAPGPVDIVVTNPDGQTSRLTGGFTYAPPNTFSFDGRWDAYVRPDWRGGPGFQIENNRVTGLWCGSEVNNLIPTPQPVVTDGAFAFTIAGGGQISGRIVALQEAAGTTTIPGCDSGPFYAYRR